MFRCVGFFEKFCRPIMIPPDFTFDSIKDAFLIKFPELEGTDRVLIQVLDVELGEYLDWDSTTTLVAGSKMRATRLAPQESAPPPAPVAASPEVMEVPMIQEGPSPTLDPKKYVFPPTPKDIAHNLSQVTQKARVPLDLRRRIVEWMCFDLFRYTL
ncbi:uncharacterized protein LOC120836002 [Ixodes scapularis]|uniref:uncharacterized protein LOC120836002 n=1 Tax=Ixodes scapularis TaxID=6945 RepID=UPI001A9D4AE0|nr:uncharacterized protein LOC120836002 [Ixodes scapularis]